MKTVQRQALKEMNLLESNAPTAPAAETSRFDNPAGSSAPFLGVSVETKRSDLGPYLKILKQLIQGNWRIPNIARYEVSGVSGIFFKIRKDGTIEGVSIGHSSTFEPLDVAALNAVTNTNPAPPLPSHVEEEWIPIKFGFYYNVRPNY